MMRFVYLLVFLCTFVPSNINGQMSFIGDALEAFNPCDEFILSMQRLIGGAPKAENYWDGTMYLSKWPTLPEIRIDLTVDNPARIELDEDVGRVTVTGNTFHIYAFGAQPSVKQVKFKVRGEPKGAFPNVLRLVLNGLDVCPNPRKWMPTILGGSNSVVETETEKQELGLSSLLGGSDRVVENKTEKQASGLLSFLGSSGKGVETETKKLELPKCGKRIVQHQGLIRNGYASKEGDWPWHAAIYHLDGAEQKYKCGGSLINSNTVLTAAHCVFEIGRPIVAQRVLVKLGKHHLQVSSPHTQEFQAFRVIIHSGFQYSDFHDDIALIRLGTEATFGNYIQPICLWSINDISLTNVLHQNGIVVGWGLNERDVLNDILNQGRMPIVSLSECLQSNRDFFGLFLSDNTFCAGFRNGTSVCNGDSGGGMYFEQNGIYSLRGIVSLTVSRADNASLCNPQEYVVFTDAARYLDWIDTFLR